MLNLNEGQIKTLSERPDGSPGIQACPNCILSQEEIDLAASEGDSPEHRAARTSVARHYYYTTPGLLANGVVDTPASREARFQEDLSGIDLSKPVKTIEMPPPPEVTQYKYKGDEAPLGAFFDPTGKQRGTHMGVNDDPNIREKVICTLPDGSPKIQALSSTASPIIDDWTNPEEPFPCEGSGDQINVPHSGISRITWRKPEIS
ncbi:MAG: hypothetical protein EOP87_00505 [Verrucomicrobiaceae bacterium]|nr:MAG: hypothetical protein EOP87_00505 [Verrucomicrobiaceae bacterium]